MIYFSILSFQFFRQPAAWRLFVSFNTNAPVLCGAGMSAVFSFQLMPPVILLFLPRPRVLRREGNSFRFKRTLPTHIHYLCFPLLDDFLHFFVSHYQSLKILILFYSPVISKKTWPLEWLESKTGLEVHDFLIMEPHVSHSGSRPSRWTRNSGKGRRPVEVTSICKTKSICKCFV